MSKVPYVCLYLCYYEELDVYTDAQVGRLVRALLRYALDGTVTPLKKPESVFWKRLKIQHDRDSEHYRDVCEKRSAAAKKSKSKQLDAIADNCTQKEKEKEKEKEKDKEKDKEKECVCLGGHNDTQFSFPSLNDVIFFCEEEGLTAMDPQKFYDHNSMMGWKTGGNPIRDWKAAARLWNSKDAEKKAPAQRKVWEEFKYGMYI